MPDARPIPPEAIAVLQTFIDASLRKDEATMRTCLNKATLEGGTFSGAGPEGMRFEIGAGAWDGDVLVIPLTGYPLDAPAGAQGGAGAPVMTLPCVMVQENGAWKLDLAAAMERMFGGQGGLEAVMNQAVSALGEAVKGIGEAFGDALGSAMGESAFDKPAPDWLAVPLEPAPEEFLPMPEMTDLPKTAAKVSAALGSPVKITAAVTDFLKQLNSTERDSLLTWFEDVLFAEFGDLFSRVKRLLPAPPLGRLHGIRMEPAKWTDDRCLVMDGNDLVYRMYLNSNDGYYSDAGVLELLPGLMAGLIEPSPADGKRTLPDDEEPASLDHFRDKTVPRWMRRISDLLGKNVALEADWDIYDPRDTRQLYRWTLNRIYGALALACLSDDRRHQLSAALRKIHVILAPSATDRWAEFTDGTLTVSLCYFQGEKGCFYERDLECVLAGEAIRPPVVEEAAEEDADTDADDKSAASATEETADTASSEEADDPSASAEPAPTDEALNDQNFKSAVASLKENEATWASSLEMCFQHPVTLHLDFDSLGGRYELVQPFIHQGLTGAIESLSRLAFDPAFKDKVPAIQGVTISALAADKPCITELAAGQLRVCVPLKLGDYRPPTKEITAALLAMHLR